MQGQVLIPLGKPLSKVTKGYAASHFLGTEWKDLELQILIRVVEFYLLMNTVIMSCRVNR